MNKKQLHGVVVAKSGAKTVSVEVSRVTRHPKYGKNITRTKKYLAHDEQEQFEVGQEATIEESRPLSARKRWVVVNSSVSDK